MDADAALDRAREAVDRAVRQLSTGAVVDEALAEWVPRRSVLGIPRRPALQPRGRVWRLGVLLLKPDGSLLSVGVSTRVAEIGHPQNLHASVEERRNHRVAALKAGYRFGDIVNHGARTILLEASALTEPDAVVTLRDDVVSVRWSPAAERLPLERYLAERVDLLKHPPPPA